MVTCQGCTGANRCTSVSECLLQRIYTTFQTKHLVFQMESKLLWRWLINLWVTAICHALVILTLHSKSPSQITSASQLLLPTSDLHILQNTSPTTCGDWDKHRSDDSPMATQQISDQESKRSPRLLTLHTLLSAVLNLSRKEPYRQDLNHLEITCKWSILKQK